MRVATGTYTGDGADNRQITGVGFTPDFVLVRGNSTNNTFAWARTFRGDAAKILSSSNAFLTDRIQGGLPDGFVIGSSTNLNNSGTAYYYLALQQDPRDCKVLTWIGDGTNNRQILGAGFQPDVVLVMAEGSGTPFWAFSSMAAGETFDGTAAAFATGNDLQFLTDGFRLDHNGHNVAGLKYHALCLKATSGLCAVFTYTGNGVDDRSVGSVGFTPDFALVKGDNTSRAVLRFEDHPAGDSVEIGTVANAANKIQAFVSGGIQIGTDATVNTDTVEYQALVLADGQTASSLTLSLVSDEATVNLHDDSYYGVNFGGDLGAPEIVRQFAEVWGRGHFPLGGVTYGNRTVTLPIQIKDSSLDGWANRSRLIHQLLRETERYWSNGGRQGYACTLWVRLNGMSNEQCFEVLGGDLVDGQLTAPMTVTSRPRQTNAQLTLITRPFGHPYGVTRITSGSLTNGAESLVLPTSSTGTLLGDVPAPARVTYQISSGDAMARVIVAARSRGITSNYVHVLEAETGTYTGYNTSAATGANVTLTNTADSSAHGSSHLVVDLGNSGTGRSCIIWNLTANWADMIGTHRGFLRFSGGPNASDAGVQIRYGGASGDDIANATVALTSGSSNDSKRWADVGKIVIPHRAGPLDPTLDAFRIRLYADNAGAGGAQLKPDALYLFPVDEYYADIAFSASGAGLDKLVMDGLLPEPAPYLLDAGDVVQSETLDQKMYTGFNIEPRRSQRFFVHSFRAANISTTGADDLTDVGTLSVDYQPLYSQLR